MRTAKQDAVPIAALTLQQENRKALAARVNQAFAEWWSRAKPGERATSRAFSSAAGIKPTTLNQLQNGQVDPQLLATMVPIARATGFSLHWLATGEGDPEVRQSLGTVPSGRVNIDVLTSAILAAENLMGDRRDLTPQRRARFIADIYDRLSGMSPDDLTSPPPPSVPS